MKVYTEVNYIWKDNKLVKTDSKSFEYEGDVEQCHRKWYPHNHAIAKATGLTIETTKKVVDTYKGSDIDKGIKSGTAATQAALNKAKKDNPKPNLNVQTPDQLYNKGRDLLHDAATVAHEFIDRNTDTISNAKDDVAEALFEPVKGKIEDTATSIITTNSPDTTPGPNEEELYSSRRNFNTMQRDGSRASGGDLRREIPVLKTLSGKAKPKSYS